MEPPDEGAPVDAPPPAPPPEAEAATGEPPPPEMAAPPPPAGAVPPPEMAAPPPPAGAVPPPEDPELKSRIDKLAAYVAKTPGMEAHVHQKQAGNADFDFLNGGTGADYYAQEKAKAIASMPPPAPVMAPPPPAPMMAPPPPMPPDAYPYGDPRPPP